MGIVANMPGPRADRGIAGLWQGWRGVCSRVIRQGGMSLIRHVGLPGFRCRSRPRAGVLSIAYMACAASMRRVAAWRQVTTS